MLDGSEFYIILKLTTGEQMMAVLLEEDDEYIQIEYPMVLRSIPIIAEGKETITAHPFCQYSDDRKFILHKTNILFVKKLHHMLIPHYQRIVTEFESTSLVSKKSEQDYLEDDITSVEELYAKIDKLRSIAGMDKEEDKPSDKSFFVEGNDTVN